MTELIGFLYGFATDRMPIALPNLVIAPACATVLVLGFVARRRRC